MPRDNKESGSIFLGLGVHNFGGYLALYFGNNWIVCRFMDFNFLMRNGVNEMNKKDIKVGMVVEIKGYAGQLFIIEKEIIPGIYTASTTIMDFEIKKSKVIQPKKNKESGPNNETN